jgi:hypothetical protein
MLARGVDAVSCDILPTESEGPHIQDDVRNHLGKRWTGIIAHPPCTRLANSGVRWLHERNLWAELDEAAALFLACLNGNSDKIAVENPVMHKHARALIGRGPDFTVQPYMFGDYAKKRTCFWTKNLAPLAPTNEVDPALAKQETWLAPPGKDRWKVRSLTYPGIAEAIAAQWC